MRRPDLSRLLDDALRAARSAGGAIMDSYGDGGAVDVTRKSDGSPLTNADMRAHEAICDELAASGIPVLSEEMPIEFHERAGWERFWLVDPLDGTKNFVAGRDDFTVNIALIEGGCAVIGVVAAPAQGRTWFASAGNGAWETRDGASNRICATAPWPEEARMFTSCFHDVPASIEFGRLNGVRHMIPSGASTKLARMAASEAEFYPRFAGTAEWDVAAGHAILAEAGGLLRTVHGDELRYNKQSLRNPFFLAWRPPLAWSDIELPPRLN